MTFDWPQPGQDADGVIVGPAGDLEVSLRRAGPPQADMVAVICHPHPQHGGTQDNKVVTTLARAAVQSGIDALRFNFRGIGASAGAYDEGRGETEDAIAAAEWALRTSGANALVWAGFSFGAAVALRAAERQPPAALVTIALPTGYFEDGLPRPDAPWLAVHGDADEVVDTQAATQALGNLSPPPVVHTLEGVGHFFHGRLTELRQVVAGFLRDDITRS